MEQNTQPIPVAAETPDYATDPNAGQKSLEPVKVGAKRGGVEALVIYFITAFAAGLEVTPMPAGFEQYAPIVLAFSVLAVRAVEAYALDR